MVEIAAEPMSIQNIAQHAYALKVEEEELEELQHPQSILQVVEQPQQLVEGVIRAGQGMDIVMISTIMLVVTSLMVEIVVEPMSIHSIVQNAYALNNEGQYTTKLFERGKKNIEFTDFP